MAAWLCCCQHWPSEVVNDTKCPIQRVRHHYCKNEITFLPACLLCHMFLASCDIVWLLSNISSSLLFFLHFLVHFSFFPIPTSLTLFPTSLPSFLLPPPFFFHHSLIFLFFPYLSPAFLFAFNSLPFYHLFPFPSCPLGKFAVILSKPRMAALMNKLNSNAGISFRFFWWYELSDSLYLEQIINAAYLTTDAFNGACAMLLDMNNCWCAFRCRG